MICTPTIRWGLRFDAWRQPRPIFGDKRLAMLHFPHFAPAALRTLDQKKNGIAISLMGQFLLSHKVPISLFGQLGYKMKGFLPGESLDNGIIAYGGLSAKF